MWPSPWKTWGFPQRKSASGWTMPCARWGCASTGSTPPTSFPVGRSSGVIAMRPRCIVLDEPTAMLDPRGRAEVMKTLRDLNREHGITIALITHYMDEAAQCDRVVVVDRGKLLMDGLPREVFSRVEELKAVGLDVPQVTELMHSLRQAGLPVREDIITEEECSEELCRLLGEGGER